MTRLRRRLARVALAAGTVVLLASLALPGAAGGADDRAARSELARQAVPTASPEPTATLPVPAGAEPTPAGTAPATPVVDLAPSTSTPGAEPVPGVEPTPGAEPTVLAATPTPEAPFPYVERVVAEINTLRTQVGLQPLLPAPPEADAGLQDYLAAITPTMLATSSCVNGATLGLGSSWDYAAARGFAAEPLGELLTCAGPAYWSPLDNVNGWRASPELRALLGDISADTIACGGYGPQPDGRGYRSFVCVVYRAFGGG